MRVGWVMIAFFTRLAALTAAAAALAGCVAPTDDALHPAQLRSVWLAGEKPASAALASIYFATDRLQDASGNFTGGWSPGLTCGEAVVSLPSDKPPGTNWGPWRTEAAPAGFTKAELWPYHQRHKTAASTPTVWKSPPQSKAQQRPRNATAC
jgi:hypothetical protein